MSDPNMELLREKAFDLGLEAAVTPDIYDQFNLFSGAFLPDTLDLGDPHAVTLLFTDPESDDPLLHRIKFIDPRLFDVYQTGLAHIMLYELPAQEGPDLMRQSPVIAKMMSDAVAESVKQYAETCTQRVGTMILLGALTLYVSTDADGAFDPSMIITAPREFISQVTCVMSAASDYESALESFHQTIINAYEHHEDAVVDDMIETLHIISSEHNDDHEPSIDRFRTNTFGLAMGEIEEHGIEYMARARSLDRIMPLFLPLDQLNPILRKRLFETGDSE